MKQILTSVLVLLVISSSKGQNDVMPACIMANAGVNLTDLNRNYFYSSNAQPGYQIGGNFRTNGDIFLMAGIQFEQINPKMTYLTTNSTDKVSMSYLQVPVLAGAHIVKWNEKQNTFHATLGGSFTTLLDVSENNVGISKDDLRTFGFTVKAGLGVDIWKLIIDLNYNLLITKVYDTPGYNNKAKLMSWELMLGYKFPLKKHEQQDAD